MSQDLRVRALRIEALERRAAGQPDAVRRVLDARLAALAAGCQQAEAAHVAHTARAEAAAPSAPQRGALGLLADALAHQSHGEMAPSAPRELKALYRFRGTWARLSAEQRLHQALAQVPPQAGPLNSHHLVHRALVLMRETSPAYLQRFVAQVDALLSLDQMQAVPLPTRGKAGRSQRRK